MSRVKGSRIPDSIKQLAWVDYINGMSKKNIAAKYNMCEFTVRNIVKNKNDHGVFKNTATGKRLGRVPTVHDGIRDFLKDLIAESPTIYLRELRFRLWNETSVDLSLATLSRTLKEMKLTRKAVHRKAAQRSDLLRTEYMNKIAHYSPEQLCFADESAVSENSTHRRWGWGRINRKVEVSTTFNRTKRHSVLPLLGIHGFLALEVIQDSYNKERFTSWVQYVALPVMNAYPEPHSVLVMDNAAIHEVESIQALCNEKGVHLVMLPPYSPDHNPIENAFGLFKRFLQSEYEETATQDLADAIFEAARRCLTPDVVVNLYAGCHYRFRDDAHRADAMARLEALEAAHEV